LPQNSDNYAKYSENYKFSNRGMWVQDITDDYLTIEVQARKIWVN
jgi:hypothetical protein